MRSLRTFRPKSLLVASGLVLAGALSNPLLAATSTWVGNTSNLWNTAGNWSGSAVPTNGSTLLFGAPGTAGNIVVDDIASLTVGGSGADGIVFGPSAPSFTGTRSGAQVLTLASSGTGVGIKDFSNFLQTISIPLAYAGDQTIQVGTTTGPALSSILLSGAQSGAFRLTKTGNGLLSLSAGNSFSGLTVNGGSVNALVETSFGAAPATPTAGYFVLNGGALRLQLNNYSVLNANRGIALGDATAGSGGTLNVYSTGAGTTLTYNGIIANNGGVNSLTKTGALGLTLGGANTYTGATKINQGQITLDFSATTAPTNNIINSASNLVMGDVSTALNNAAAGNSALFVQGGTTSANSQTFNGAAFNVGNSSVVVRSGSSASNTTLALGALSHTAGATVGFSSLTGGSTGLGIITTSATNTNGIIGGWATTAAVQSGTVAATQTDWATVSSGSIVAYTGYTDFVTAAPVVSNAASNFRITGTSTGNITLSSGTTDLNTIQATDALGRTIAIGAGNTLRLGASGGVWKTAAANTTLVIGVSGIGAGTLTAGGAANTPGEIVFNANGAATTNGTIQVNSVIADNGTGAVSVVKTGIAILTLTGSNTFTGGTYVNQGTINASNANAFGGAGRDVTVLAGGAVSLTATALTYANNFNIAGTSSLLLGGNTASGKVTLLGDAVIGASSVSNGGTITGQITGDYNLSFLGGTTTVSSALNNYSGNLGINGTTGALGNAPVVIKLGNNDVLSNGAGKGNVYIAGGTTAPSGIDMNGKTETINGLVSSGTLVNVRITNSAAATTGLLILGDNDQTTSYGGTIVDGAGKVAITKIGSGVQTFSGSNSYTGTTTVSAGTLLLSSSTLNSTIASSATIDVQANAKLDVTNITAVGGFQVSSGQTLKGNGTVVGGVTINSGGFLSPGASPGNLTVTNGLAVAGTYNWELGALSTSNPGTDYDTVTVTAGNIDLTGGAITLTLGAFAPTNVAFWQTNETWAGILNNTGAGSLTGNFGAIDNSAWSSLGSFSTVAVGNDLNLVWTAVPEPSTWALLAGAGTFFVIMRRRRVAQ